MDRWRDPPPGYGVAGMRRQRLNVLGDDRVLLCTGEPVQGQSERRPVARDRRRACRLPKLHSRQMQEKGATEGNPRRDSLAWRREHLVGWTTIAVAMVLTGCSTTLERGPVGSDVAPLRKPGRPELGRGMASWYGPGFHGKRTASGERFDMNDLTAAHRTLPFGTRLRVRNMDNGLEVVVRINDRGPRVRDRVIDLSKAAAEALELLQAGVAPVTLFEL
jgi:rare lipoprotein A